MIELEYHHFAGLHELIDLYSEYQWIISQKARQAPLPPHVRMQYYLEVCQRAQNWSPSNPLYPASNFQETQSRGTCLTIP